VLPARRRAGDVGPGRPAGCAAPRCGAGWRSGRPFRGAGGGPGRPWRGRGRSGGPSDGAEPGCSTVRSALTTVPDSSKPSSSATSAGWHPARASPAPATASTSWAPAPAAVPEPAAYGRAESRRPWISTYHCRRRQRRLGRLTPSSSKSSPASFNKHHEPPTQRANRDGGRPDRRSRSTTRDGAEAHIRSRSRAQGGSVLLSRITRVTALSLRPITNGLVDGSVWSWKRTGWWVCRPGDR
jgi:hypothetical protein